MADDPNLFRQFFEQFDTLGSAESLPGAGFPLSPVPIPGSDPSGMSPEDSTKRAIRQLYGTLETLSGGGAQQDLYQQYVDAFGIDASAFGPEQFTAATVRTYRIWFYSLAQLLVESYSLRLIHDRLVVEGHRQSTRTQEWLWGLPQSDREQLLSRCTDVGDDLVDEMQTFRKRRDELLYTFGGWDSVEFDESLDDARQALNVLTALDDLATEGSPFSFVSDGDDAGTTENEDGESDA